MQNNLVVQVRSKTWLRADRQAVEGEFEIRSSSRGFVVAHPGRPAGTRLEPLFVFLRDWRTGRSIRRIFSQLPHQRFEVLHGAVIETRADGEIIVRGGELDGQKF